MVTPDSPPPEGYDDWLAVDRVIAEFMEPNKGKLILVGEEYHSDDSPRRLLNEVENRLFEQGLQAIYHRHLVGIVMDADMTALWREVQGIVVAPAINAMAQQRCVAILRTLDNLP